MSDVSGIFIGQIWFQSVIIILLTIVGLGFSKNIVKNTEQTTISIGANMITLQEQIDELKEMIADNLQVDKIPDEVVIELEK